MTLPMPASAQLTLFLLASAILCLTPGPAVLYILARSIGQGRAAGLASVGGVAVGNLAHAIGAALGLSAILASSALAFAGLKYVGAAYLIWLGIRKFRSAPVDFGAASFRPEPLRRIFRQGVVVGTLNPKTALFFLSFLPQFADPARGSAPVQLLLLGVAFVTMAAISDSAYALLSGTFGAWIKRRPAFLRHERHVTGSVYVGLGLLAATSSPPKPA